MSVWHELPKYQNHLMQKCPFCKGKQPVLVRGAHTTMVDGKYNSEVFPDLGYSFCNCKNIFYTNWQNINQDVYDENYEDKHSSDVSKEYAKNFWKMHEEEIVWKTTGDKFLEIGAVTPYLLDNVRKKGFKTTALDIIKHDWYGFKVGEQEIDLNLRHEMITANFEDWDGNIIYDDFMVPQKYDVIWASHVFEHFHYPLKALKKCHELLNDGGLLFVAMPDPFFINWGGVYSWCHWHLREHHIFWDMDSFGDECKTVGFQVLYKKRNSVKTAGVFGDYHMLMRKL